MSKAIVCMVLWMMAFFAGAIVLWVLIKAVAVALEGGDNEHLNAVMIGIWTWLPAVVLPGSFLLVASGKLPGTRLQRTKTPPKIPKA